MLKMWENTHIYSIYDDLHQYFSKFKMIYLNYKIRTSTTTDKREYLISRLPAGVRSPKFHR